MNPVFLVLIGFGLGIAVWFPYRHILNRLVKKKRETTSILKELSMTEKEHLSFMDPSHDWTRSAPYTHTFGTTTNTWVSNNTNPANTSVRQSYDELTKAYVDMMAKNTTATLASQATQAVLSQTYQVQPGTSSPAFSVSTNLDARYCTHCNGLVGSESHSCERGTDAR